MATFLSRNAPAAAVAALTLTLAGGGIAAARGPADRPADRVHRVVVQPPVSAEDVRTAKAALASAEMSTMATSPGTVAWAVVSANGTLLRGSPEVFSAKRYSTGQYQIIFRYTVSGKGYGATVGTTDQYNVPPPGEAAVAPRNGTVNAVFVATYSSSGALADKPFHLVVFN
ncbi:hypothetical protein [Micromonospora siamensis]|uniref:Secreted protein n=1 Tax=Micromonospora siamensis TaxID=299152 RepID=A0A1C5HLJ8_9ACTN|nr:hypothetical protein [Micromonospora siamensis]SCG46865.1 hypothetical protein GA0074704_1956 [Micromonospora siamensis]